MNATFQRCFIIFILIAAKHSCLLAQINAGVNIESGFYKSINGLLSQEGDLQFAVETKLGYKFKSENTEASVDLKARPDWFGRQNNLLSFKFRGSGNFLRRENNFDWGINVARQFNNLSGKDVDIDYDIFSFQLNSTFYFIEDIPLSVAMGYAYQNIGVPSNQNHDIVFVEAKASTIYNSFFRTSYVLYAERFVIEAETITGSMKKNETNPGFGIGPGLELNYFKSFVANLQYKFLINYSEYSGTPSYENWIRLVAGKILLSDFSVFVLVDYYWRSIKNTGSADLNILYSPFNRENNIGFKFSYDLSDNSELYLKCNYFRSDLIYNNYFFEGWNVLLGTGISL